MDSYISTSEAAKLAGLSQPYIRDLCANGRIASSKFGQTLMIERASLLAHIASVKQWRKERRKKAGEPQAAS
jgi:excisionase family DNA binding protein